MKRYKVTREVEFAELRSSEMETYHGYTVPPGIHDWNKELLDLLDMEHTVKMVYRPGVPAEVTQELNHILHLNKQIVAQSPSRGPGAFTMLTDSSKIETTYIGEEPVVEEKGPPPP